ncbi:hypothetical protein [Candidatus Magnetaquiglobus chichijimensis]|uniref:hypothetical protein n=1 Tax=Candidatus Magnetaquiglobus chichijimensis TaxID=3141448 RepID=UPI003B97514A
MKEGRAVVANLATQEEMDPPNLAGDPQPDRPGLFAPFDEELARFEREPSVMRRACD